MDCWDSSPVCHIHSEEGLSFFLLCVPHQMQQTRLLLSLFLHMKYVLEGKRLNNGERDFPVLKFQREQKVAQRGSRFWAFLRGCCLVIKRINSNQVTFTQWIYMYIYCWQLDCWYLFESSFRFQWLLGGCSSPLNPNPPGSHRTILQTSPQNLHLQTRFQTLTPTWLILQFSTVLFFYFFYFFFSVSVRFSYMYVSLTL